MGEKKHRRNCPTTRKGSNSTRTPRPRGLAYALGAKESEELRAKLKTERERQPIRAFTYRKKIPSATELPSYEQIRADKELFAEPRESFIRTRIRLTPKRSSNSTTDRRWSRHPALPPLRRRSMRSTISLIRADHIPATLSHPRSRDDQGFRYADAWVLWRMHILSITAHQGRIIQSRSQESVLKEAVKLAADPEFKGIVGHRRSDGKYVLDALHSARVEAKCKRLSCVHPPSCKLLGTVMRLSLT